MTALVAIALKLIYSFNDKRDCCRITPDLLVKVKLMF